MREGWRQAALGDIALINPESTPRWPDDKPIRYVDIASVKWGAPVPTDLPSQPFGQAPGRARRLIRAGDVIASTVRPNLRSFAVVPNELDGEVASTGFAVLRAKQGTALPGFIWALVSHERFRDDMVARATGSNYPAVRPADVAGHKILLPPLAEQRRVVDLVGAIDDAIDAADRHCVSLAASFDAVAAALVPDPALGCQRLRDVVRLIDCEHKTAPETTSDSFGHSIGTGDVRRGRIATAAAKVISRATWEEWTARAAPLPGDVILTREAPAGEVGLVTEALGPIALGQRTVLIQPKEGTYGPYVWALLASPSYRRWLSARNIGQTVQRVNVKTLNDMPVTLPDWSDQVTVAGILQDALSLQVGASDAIDDLRVLRSNILTVLLSGEHEIPDSYDELLEVAS